jgi:putative membrane protein
MSDGLKSIFADWSLPIWLTCSILITAAIYLRGWLAIRKTRREQFNNVRLISFFAGLAILWLAIGSPMDGLADALLSAHMVEHLLLMSVVPPLLLYGLPTVPLLRGLPSAFTRFALGPLLRIRPLRKLVRWLVTPVVAWLAMNIAFLAWHIPRAYDFALEHENWHVIEHICFLFSSLLFWWCIVRPWPARRTPRDWWVLLYLVAADIVNTLLSAFPRVADRRPGPWRGHHVGLWVHHFSGSGHAHHLATGRYAVYPTSLFTRVRIKGFLHCAAYRHR